MFWMMLQTKILKCKCVLWLVHQRDHKTCFKPTVADTIYLVVDTNILLGHIHILKNLVEDIASTRVPLVVICPGIVLNELDRCTSSILIPESILMTLCWLESSQKTKSDRLGRRARSATDWMLREVTRKDLPQSIVKGQAQQETCKSTKNWKTRDETEVGLVHLSIDFFHLH